MDSNLTDATLDRGKEFLRLIIRAVLSELLYHVQWMSTVVVQDDDGTLQVQPDSKLIPGMKGVKIRLGLPGVEVKVKPQARVMVGFENGDPQKPYAHVWDMATLDSIKFTGATSLNINAPTVELVPDGLATARSGDMVAVGGPAMTPVPCTIVPTAPITVAGSPTGPWTIVPGTPIVGAIVLQAPVYGTVVSGNPNVKS